MADEKAYWKKVELEALDIERRVELAEVALEHECNNDESCDEPLAHRSVDMSYTTARKLLEQTDRADMLAKGLDDCFAKLEAAEAELATLKQALRVANYTAPARKALADSPHTAEQLARALCAGGHSCCVCRGDGRMCGNARDTEAALTEYAQQYKAADGSAHDEGWFDRQFVNPKFRNEYYRAAMQGRMANVLDLVRTAIADVERVESLDPRAKIGTNSNTLRALLIEMRAALEPK